LQKNVHLLAEFRVVEMHYSEILNPIIVDRQK